MKPKRRSEGGFNLYRSLLISLAALALLVLSSTSIVNAASGASGLSISPLRQDLTLSANEVYQIPITLKNVTGGSIIAKPIIRDFTSDNFDGNPKIITSPNYYDPASIRNFFTSLSSVTLSEGEQETVNANIKMPPNVSPGAYYGLIEYQAEPSNVGGATGNNKVALTAAVSELVFITVPGNVTQSMEINAINTYHDKQGNNAGLFFTKAPEAAGIALTNLGNAFEKPFGTVTIQNFGKTVDTYQVNSGNLRGIVLPKSARTFINPIKNITKPGPYTVTASISYGSGSTILVAKKTFWYLPSWIILIVILIVLLLILGVWTARRRYKRSTARNNYRR